MRYKLGQKAIKEQPIKVKSVDRNNFTLTMVASTQDTDRHGDVVIQSGWNVDRFKKNPVILNSHRYDDATEVIAKATRTEVVGKGKRSRLEQDWKFAVEENPKAKVIFDLYAGGFLSASSVGFIPTKFKDDKGQTDYFTIEEAELLEVSAVSVPANAAALAKSKGIDVEGIEDIIEEEPDEPEDEDIEEDDEADEVEDTEEADEPETEEEEEVEEAPGEAPEAPESDASPEPDPEPAEPKSVDYARIIRRVALDREAKLLKAKRAIDRVLEGREAQEGQRKQINKAIRSLIDAK